MTKRVLVLEDDPGYEALLRNVAEGRGWEFNVGATYDDIVISVEWADVAVIDLDASAGPAALRSVRGARPAMPVVAITSDRHATAESTGADAVVHSLPAGLAEAVNEVTVAPTVVIDLTTAAEPVSERPWYATS
jgi:DNA-binding response OmpR family regulator